VALAGTILPWSARNYSHYTGAFGGWGFSPLAWSIVATVGALAGLSLWAMLMLSPARGGPSPPWWTITLAAALIVVGTVLYLVRPPFATHPWLGPWVTLASGMVAMACWVRVGSELKQAPAGVP
jgi:hypothetical protein